jgi:hypothetical protein
MGHLTYTALKDSVFAHPTLAESLNNLFRAMDRGEASAGRDEPEYERGVYRARVARRAPGPDILEWRG